MPNEEQLNMQLKSRQGKLKGDRYTALKAKLGAHADPKPLRGDFMKIA